MHVPFKTTAINSVPYFIYREGASSYDAYCAASAALQNSGIQYDPSSVKCYKLGARHGKEQHGVLLSINQLCDAVHAGVDYGDIQFTTLRGADGHSIYDKLDRVCGSIAHDYGMATPAFYGNCVIGFSREFSPEYGCSIYTVFYKNPLKVQQLLDRGALEYKSLSARMVPKLESCDSLKFNAPQVDTVKEPEPPKHKDHIDESKFTLQVPAGMLTKTTSIDLTFKMSDQLVGGFINEWVEALSIESSKIINVHAHMVTFEPSPDDAAMTRHAFVICYKEV